MKTGEMYTHVLNNPEARFHRLNMNNASYGFVNGTLVYGENKIATEIPRPDEDWELVPQPVDFLTAVNSGKKIRPDDEPAKIHGFNELGYWSLNIDRINGKWLVE